MYSHWPLENRPSDALVFTKYRIDDFIFIDIIYRHIPFKHSIYCKWKSHGVWVWAQNRNLPLAANEMKAWACFFILLTSVCFLLIGKRTNKCSRKSNGVTDEMFHFNLFKTISSHCCKERKRRRKNIEI